MTHWPAEKPYELELVEDADALGSQVVEDALAHQAREDRRWMRPIEDAAALDPDDPQYQEKLAVLVEEVRANLAAGESG